MYNPYFVCRPPVPLGCIYERTGGPVHLIFILQKNHADDGRWTGVTVTGRLLRLCVDKANLFIVLLFVV